LSRIELRLSAGRVLPARLILLAAARSSSAGVAVC
jgi:hypothetical protein